MLPASFKFLLATLQYWMMSLATKATAAFAIASSTRPSLQRTLSRSVWQPLKTLWQPKTPAVMAGVSYAPHQEVSTRQISSWERTEKEKEMTEDALTIVRKAIDAVDPYTAIQSHVHFDAKTNSLQVGATRRYDMTDYDDIVVVAFGKASSAMATAVVEELSNENGETNCDIRGVVVVKDDHGTQKERDCLGSHGVSFREASHPVPDERSAKAAKEIMDVVSQTANPRTLVICCISGGGSSLFCLPKAGLTLKDLQDTNSVLLESGLTIQEMNVIRKRLEEGKGGRLAAAAYPSTVASLVLSDVLGDPLDLIASGPTVADTSNWNGAWKLIQKNSLEDKLPKKVVQLIKDGMSGTEPDSPSDDHPIFQEGKCETIVVGGNERAVEAAANEAERLGYHTRILGSRVEGEAQQIAYMYAALCQNLSMQQNGEASPFAMAELPAALISGGETTVSISSGEGGKGGRNQELALASALRFRELKLRDVVLASVGTDGTDGPTDAAGAVVDGGTLDRLEGSVDAAEEALRKHDSYHFLNQHEEDMHSPLIKTGPSGTNVADVCVVLVR